MEKGDLVKVTDGSYAVRVDCYEKYSHIGNSKDNFEVIAVDNISSCDHLTDGGGEKVHNIIIQNKTDKKIYLHSKRFLSQISKIKVTIDGKEGYISKESAEELKKML